MIEAIHSLKGKMPEDLGDVVITIGSVILALATKSKNLKANEDTVKEITGKSGSTPQSGNWTSNIFRRS